MAAEETNRRAAAHPGDGNKNQSPSAGRGRGADMADKDLSESEDVRRLTPAELRKLNKEHPQFALRTLINEPAEETAAGPRVVQMSRIESKLDDLLAVSLLSCYWSSGIWKKKPCKTKSKSSGEIERRWQKPWSRMLESIEAERRAANVIMTGVPDEQNLEDAVTDIEVKLVLSTIGQHVVEVKRVE